MKLLNVLAMLRSLSPNEELAEPLKSLASVVLDAAEALDEVLYVKHRSRAVRLGDVPSLVVSRELTELFQSVTRGQTTLKSDALDAGSPADVAGMTREEATGAFEAALGRGTEDQSAAVDAARHPGWMSVELTMEALVTEIVDTFAVGGFEVSEEAVEGFLKREVRFSGRASTRTDELRRWISSTGPKGAAAAMIGALAGVTKDRLQVVERAAEDDPLGAIGASLLPDDVGIVDYVLQALGYGERDRREVCAVLRPPAEPSEPVEAVPVPPAPPMPAGWPSYTGSPSGRPPSAQIDPDVRGPLAGDSDDAGGDDDA